jgi:transcriptional regulator with XRE-family HTH domain
MGLPSAGTMRRRMPRPTLVKLPSLAHWRIRRGLSQRALGEQAGTSRVNVGRIETGGETRPSMARRLAEALGVQVDDLLRQPPDD